MPSEAHSTRPWPPWLAPFAFIALAAALRVWPLHALGGRLAWLTFYPTVMAAALYGGFWAGLLGAGLSCLAVLFVLPPFLGAQLVSDPIDWLGLAIFFLTCSLISGLAEAMRRARAQEQQAVAERDRFFSLSLDMLCISNSDGYFKRLSPAFTQTLGWSMKELMTKPFIDRVHPEDRAATLLEVEKQIKDGQRVLHFENRYQHQDGSYRWLSWKSVPQPGGFMYATARDITELKDAEAALRRSEESLDVTLQSIGDGMLATDTQGRITRMNPIAEQLTGWTQAEALGRPVEDVFRIINEGSRQPSVIPVAKVLATGEIHGLANHTVLLARDGSETPIADSAAPIRTQDGAMLGVILVFRDVAEEQRAERALRDSERNLRTLNEELERRVEARTSEVRQALATLDATQDAAFIFDPDSLAFTYVNEGAVQQLGYPREALLAMTMPDLNRSHSVEGLRELLAPVREGRVRAQQITTFHRHQSGREVPVEVNVQYVAPPGEAPRFLAMARDITERRKNENLAFRSQRLESLGTLAGGVAHDLNNALAPILMGVEILHAKYPEDAGVVDLFEASAKRGAALVRQLLTFAKGSEGKLVAINTTLLVQTLLAMLGGTLPKNIRLRSSFAEPLPALRGDPTQVEQILLNLCVNARDAMPEGGTLTLEVKARVLDAPLEGTLPESRPGTYLAMGVRDTGVGIEPKVLERIFEPFFSTKAADQGTGLGLSTVMGILKTHGGFMQVLSTPGEGSLFTAFLPMDGAEACPAPIGQGDGTLRGAGRMILLVDDEGPIREVGSLVLHSLGFKVVTAADGAEGLLRVQDHRDELCAVIADLHMPALDGLGFARALKGLAPALPMLVASGRMEDKDREAFGALGVAAFLDKPFTETQLAGALRLVISPPIPLPGAPGGRLG